MLQRHRHTLRTCKNYLSSTATMATRAHFIVTVSAHCNVVSVHNMMCEQTQQSVTVWHVAAVRSVRFYVNHVFSTPTQCTYMYQLSSYLRHVSGTIAPSSGRTSYISAHIYIKILPEDRAMIAETCRRKHIINKRILLCMSILLSMRILLVYWRHD